MNGTVEIDVRKGIAWSARRCMNCEGDTVCGSDTCLKCLPPENSLQKKKSRIPKKSGQLKFYWEK